jgi:hypothetical protein
MNEEMVKSIASLIDESLAELEVMKKSERFSASEIKLGGPGSGIAGKDPQGSLGKEEDKDEEDKDEEEDEDEEEGDKKPDMDKAEGKNAEAAKADCDSPEMGKAEDKKKEEEDKKKDEEEDKKKDKEDMKKSLDEQSTLLKSYVDSKFANFETQLEKIAKLVADIADAPVPSKSVSYRGITPLNKSVAESDGEGQALTKSSLVEKLFDLKKSGTRVDSTDIASAELADGHALVKIANKYNIK